MKFANVKAHAYAVFSSFFEHFQLRNFQSRRRRKRRGRKLKLLSHGQCVSLKTENKLIVSFGWTSKLAINVSWFYREWDFRIDLRFSENCVLNSKRWHRIASNFRRTKKNWIIFQWIRWLCDTKSFIVCWKIRLDMIQKKTQNIFE